MPYSRRHVLKLLVKTAVIAAVPNLVPRPARAGAGRPRFQVAEKYARRLVCTGTGASRVCEAVESGKYRLTISIPLSETDITTFDGTTRIRIEAAETVIDFALGDTPGYVPGRTRAQFTKTAPGPLGTVLTYQSARLHWDRKSMRIRVDTVTPDLAEPLYGIEFLDRLSGRYYEIAETTVTVANTTIVFQLDLYGKTVTRVVTRGDEEFDVSSTSITSQVFSNDWED